MVKQQSSLRPAYDMVFEYADGAIYKHQCNSLLLRGISNNRGHRPAYITVTNTNEERDYLLPDLRKQIEGLAHVLSGESTSRNRIMIKPLWFHRMVYRSPDE